MTQAPIVSPTTVDTTLIQDGQAPGSITPADAREMNDSLASMPITTQSGNYTFALGDFGTLVEYNSGSPGTFTLPLNAIVALGVGTVISFRQVNTGQLTIAGAVGVTLVTSTSLTTRAQWSRGSAHKRTTDTWVIDGDMT